MSLIIPKKLATLAPLRWGKKGEEWIASLPKIIEECSQRFDVKVGEAFEMSYANYVANAKKSDGTEVVIKIGYPEGEAINEQLALVAFGGRASVHVLHHSPELVTMIIDKVQPGTMLTSVTDDKEATRIAAQLMKDLHCDAPKDHSFDTIAKVLEVFDRIGTTHPLPKQSVQKARDLFKKLDNTSTEEKLLHGDLHHYNILKDDVRGWVAIDPQGVVGEPVYEVGQYFNNPYYVEKVQDPIGQSLQRAEIFADTFQCTQQRVLEWAYVQCMVSAAWSIEDNEDHCGSYAWAKVIEKALDTNF